MDAFRTFAVDFIVFYYFTNCFEKVDLILKNSLMKPWSSLVGRRRYRLILATSG